MSSIMPVRPELGESSGYPIGNPSDNLTKNTSPVSIINPDSVLSDNPTKDPPHVPNELSSYNPSNMLIVYPSGNTTSTTRTMPDENSISNTRSQTSSDPDALKRGIQEEPSSLHRYLIIFILHIISSLSSSQRATHMRQLVLDNK